MGGPSDRSEALIVDDFTSALCVYICRSYAGAATSKAVWACSVFTYATGKMTWADGDCLYNNIADNRATLSYS